MSKRKSNKQVKASIVSIMDKKSGIKYPYGFYYLGPYLYYCFIDGCGPDDYYERNKTVFFGTVSIKANENK